MCVRKITLCIWIMRRCNVYHLVRVVFHSFSRLALFGPTFSRPAFSVEPWMWRYEEWSIMWTLQPTANSAGRTSGGGTSYRLCRPMPSSCGPVPSVCGWLAGRLARPRTIESSRRRRRVRVTVPAPGWTNVFWASSSSPPSAAAVAAAAAETGRVCMCERQVRADCLTQAVVAVLCVCPCRPSSSGRCWSLLLQRQYFVEILHAYGALTSQ